VEHALHLRAALDFLLPGTLHWVGNQYEDFRRQWPAAFNGNKAYGATIRD